MQEEGTTKSRKIRILFLCGANAARSQMAEGFLRAMAPERAEATSAGIRADRLDPMTVQVMQEAGVDISGQQAKTLADLGPQTFDLVVTTCDAAREFCCDAVESADGEEPAGNGSGKNPLFVGTPVRVDWNIPDPIAAANGGQSRLEEFRVTRDRIRDHVQELVDAYLPALDDQRKYNENLLDAMEDGIVVHDHNRHIFQFNRSAEHITGYRREEVLGRNCHEVFPPDGICGASCVLNQHDWAERKRHRYEVGFTDRQGVEHRLRVTSVPLELQHGGPRGILATLRDVSEVTELRRRMKEKYSFHGMVGHSEVMQDVFRIIRQVTTSDYPVLITGESGTGKELVARAIHNESRRAGGPFVPVNCGALPTSILESELFGHVRGAFTGAIRDKKGRFELAHKGTLFLDEVGELDAAFQVKLLRVIEQQRFEPVGGERTVEVNVRLISATNRDLKIMVDERSFRDDLFYRLAVVPIHLPPLRNRTEDLVPLAEKILENIRGETGRSIHTITDESLDLLLAYHWPGNIRQLINVLQFASVRTESDRIEPRHLPPEIRTARPAAAPARRNRKLTIEAVEQALATTGGNKVQAARVLGVGRATLYRFLDKNPVS